MRPVHKAVQKKTGKPSIIPANPKQLPQAAPALLVVLITCLLLTACGQREIRDLPPLVRLSQIQLGESDAQVQLRIENPNDIPFHAEQISFELSFEQEPALPFAGATPVDIIAHSAEEVVVRMMLPNEWVERMQQLMERESLSWTLKGTLPQLEERDWPFRSRGVLFPVPGIDGLYRASAMGSAYPIRR